MNVSVGGRRRFLPKTMILCSAMHRPGVVAIRRCTSECRQRRRRRIEVDIVVLWSILGKRFRLGFWALELWRNIFSHYFDSAVGLIKLGRWSLMQIDLFCLKYLQINYIWGPSLARFNQKNLLSFASWYFGRKIFSPFSLSIIIELEMKLVRKEGN